MFVSLVVVVINGSWNRKSFFSILSVEMPVTSCPHSQSCRVVAKHFNELLCCVAGKFTTVTQELENAA